ncbi:DEKNAAC102668 [Brettanomyces naardenensis]|uniref:DEKNAAC102668 n=1 Tax=Brettanomyces naardenensis TaxID=13370 RepID=A0A448YLI5_BRENA|nr:DEKNAAC102668 [Brettanomyces naardenensis]
MLRFTGGSGYSYTRSFSHSLTHRFSPSLCCPLSHPFNGSARRSAHRLPDKLISDDHLADEAFGQLVNEAINGRNPLHNHRVLTPEEADQGVDPRYRDPQTGELLDGATSREARLDARTLKGRVNRNQIKIPQELSKVIKYNMLFAYEPRHFKQQAAQYYMALNENGLPKPADNELETDVIIATTFSQNYAVAYQVLDELRKRVGIEKFNPKKVLDCGNGPGVGMLALNELMGEGFNPVKKDVYVGGSYYMMRRAKVMLSRQVNEAGERGEASGPVDDVASAEQVTNAAAETVTEQANDSPGATILPETDVSDSVGDESPFFKVRTKNLHIKSVLLNKLRPKSRKYDLIIAENQLLKDRSLFPHQVDDQLDELVARLEPGGYLVLLERGNPLGAESIARARQVILRPENNEGRVGKVAREYRKRGTTERSEVEESLMEEASEQLQVEPEILENYDVEVQQEQSQDLAVNLRILAPCPHHGPCPLQYFNPNYYRYGQLGKKLKFCSFSINVLRPPYLLELKQGSRLATKWTDKNSGEGIKGLAKAGNGRAYGLDYETAHYSYLIVERSSEDPSELANLRLEEEELREVGYRSTNEEESPRVLAPPLKRKGLVCLDVCGPSGHAEKWYISKSTGKQDFHDARKVKMGDLWELGVKSAIQSRKENTFYMKRLQEKEAKLREMEKRNSDRLKRKIKKDYKDAIGTEVNEGDLEGRLRRMAKIDAYEFLKNERT